MKKKTLRLGVITSLFFGMGITSGCGDDGGGKIENIADQINDAGHLYMAVRLPGSFFGGADDARIVTVYNFSSFDGESFVDEQPFIYDVAGTSGAADGDIFCQVDHNPTKFTDIPGFDPLVRQKQTETRVADDCGFGIGTTDYISEVRMEAGGPIIATWEPTTDLNEAFPGYFFETGGSALPFALCSASDFVAGKPYCATRCDFPCDTGL